MRPTIRTIKTVRRVSRPRDAEFSDRSLEKVQPKSRDYFIHDPKTKGLSVKVTPKGKKVFILRYRSRTGRQRKLTLGTYPEISVPHVRRLAQERWSEIFRDIDPAETRFSFRSGPTVQDLVSVFLLEQAKPTLSPSTLKAARALRDAGVLRPLRTNSPIYVVTDEFEAAQRGLTSLGSH